MTTEALRGGFTDAPVQSARAFRILLEALARPGTIHEIAGGNPPAPLSPAAGIALLTLADGTTPIFLCDSVNTGPVRDWIRFHIGAPVVSGRDPSDCAASAIAFACGTLGEIAFHKDSFPIGDPDYPDRSATLIIEVPELTNTGAALTGPGIRTVQHLSLPELALFQQNHALFPLGFDFILTCGTRLAGVPRSTAIGEN